MYKTGGMKAQMFLSSLLILFIMMFFLNLDIPMYRGEDAVFIGVWALIKRNIVPIVCLIFIYFSWRFVKTFNFKISSGTQEYFEIKSIKNKNYEHLTFLATYIVPLIFFDLSKLNHIVALVMLLVVIGRIYVKTDIYYANPTLALIGYHLYEATVTLRDEKDYESCILITRDKISESSELEYLRIDEDIFFVKEKRNNEECTEEE